MDTRDDPRFNSFLIDTDNDEIKEQHHFERRPLYAEISPAQGAPFRVLGLHLKSKGIFGAYEWSKWWEMADASEKRLHGSGIESLMGTIWQPDQCLGKALFDALKPKAQKALDFSSIYTTSYRDPIFNNVKQNEWIDHILYSKSPRSN
jgi:hypothetical protein